MQLRTTRVYNIPLILRVEKDQKYVGPKSVDFEGDLVVRARIYSAKYRINNIDTSLISEL